VSNFVQQAYRLFNADNNSKGISFKTFNHALMVQFGLKVDQQQSRRLFNHFDSTGKGHLMLQDLSH
jgi:Ca2+-binding EF-hand superfamily protein